VSISILFISMTQHFHSLDEFFQAADTLVGKLRRESCLDAANRLYTLLHKVSWSSNAEQLGELMLALLEMKGRGPECLREEICECLEFTRHHTRISEQP